MEYNNGNPSKTPTRRKMPGGGGGGGRKRSRAAERGGGDDDDDDDEDSRRAPSSSSSSFRGALADDRRGDRRRMIDEGGGRSWGFGEVLAECGLVEFATPASPPPIPAPSSGSSHDMRRLGCRLESGVSPSTLRSSLTALLREMSASGIDPNNERVLGEMEGVVLGGGFGSSDDDGDGYGDGDGGGGGGSGRESGGRGSRGGKGPSFRQMLLPMYRVRRRAPPNNASSSSSLSLSQRYFDLSQFSQPSPDDGRGGDGGDVGGGGGGGGGTKIAVESSSLVRILLGVDALQPTLLASLLRKLTDAASSSGDRDGDGENEYIARDDAGGDDDDDDVPRLVLSNVRWLDHVADHASLTDAYVECLTVLSTSSTSCDKARGVLLDALAALPDVLGDSVAHRRRRGGGRGDANGGSNNNDGGDDGDDGDDPILSTLHHLRTHDPTLLVPCLDAIGSLPLSDGMVISATRDAVEALASVDPSGLPALATFLMTRCPAGGMAAEVVEELRNLPLGGGDGGDGCLVIESLSRGFAHRPDMTSALLRLVRETPAGGRHPLADVWLLACCAHAPHNRQRVKSLFKSKANSGAFTSSLLRESLCGNGVALTSLFATSLCDLADGLLRTVPSSSSSSSSSSSAAVAAGCGGGGGGASACELGVTLYGVLFEEFRDPMQRQEVVGSLVTHVGSGVSVGSSEVDAALRVFCGIIDNDKTKRRAASVGGVDCEVGALALRPFAPFLTSMLDHLHSMTPSQVRRLFLLLFAVGGSDDDEGDDRDPMGGGATRRTGGGACDDVHIVIRKHLSLAPFAMKRIVSFI